MDYRNEANRRVPPSTINHFNWLQWRHSHLPSISDELFEDAILISQSVSIGRQTESCHRIEEARSKIETRPFSIPFLPLTGQSSQSSITQSRILFNLLELLDIQTELQSMDHSPPSPFFLPDRVPHRQSLECQCSSSYSIECDPCRTPATGSTLSEGHYKSIIDRYIYQQVPKLFVPFPIPFHRCILFIIHFHYSVPFSSSTQLPFTCIIKTTMTISHSHSLSNQSILRHLPYLGILLIVVLLCTNPSGYEMISYGISEGEVVVTGSGHVTVLRGTREYGRLRESIDTLMIEKWRWRLNAFLMLETFSTCNTVSLN